MSNRIIYVAIGEFLGETKESALSLLKRWERKFVNDDNIALDAIFTSLVARKCSDVERAIIDFEKQVGERTRIEVLEGFSSPLRDIHSDSSIAIQNIGAKLFSSSSENLAKEISVHLEDILTALGATKTVSGYID